MSDPNPLQKFTFLILIASGATNALSSGMSQMQLKSSWLVIGGPGAIFVFICLLGAAFLDPEHFGNVITWLRGSAGSMKRRP